MDKHEREQLKHDVFVDEVTHTIDYAASHKKQLTTYAGIAVAVLAVAGGWWFWSGKQLEARQALLQNALQDQQSVVGPGTSPFVRSYTSQELKDQATIKSFSGIIEKYPSSDEAAIGHYYIGITYADQGKFPEAEKEWQIAVDKGSKEYAALARFSLAQMYSKQGKLPQAEEHLRYLIDHPTALVSKENAQIELAKVIAPSKPDEAKKMLEPLRQLTTRSSVSRWAISAYSEASAPQKK
ncbi:MAG TPA: tetratricopeptide repeat protein [Bryobacteraceae bacterium]|nr:tetratricopeptide repeat protein [Bryobacteraceae bacterium]